MIHRRGDVARTGNRGDEPPSHGFRRAARTPSSSRRAGVVGQREPPLSQEDYELLAYFRHHIRKFLVFSETAARADGLTPQQHQALLAIQGTSGALEPTIGELSQKLLIRHHSAVGLVDRLVAAGYLRRVGSVRDKREVRLRLTPKARHLLDRLSRRHRAELHRISPVLRAILHKLEGRERPRKPTSRKRRSPRAPG